MLASCEVSDFHANRNMQHSLPEIRALMYGFLFNVRFQLSSILYGEPPNDQKLCRIYIDN